ncbi:MAG: hypothetical protein PVS2B1_20440 [Candidatus Dormibacteraceae bacterium]
MENRATFRGAGTSKWLVALSALMITLALAVAAAFVAASFGTRAIHTSTVSTEADPTCPLANCNLRSVTEAAPAGAASTEPVQIVDGTGPGLVP